MRFRRRRPAGPCGDAALRLRGRGGERGGSGERGVDGAVLYTLFARKMTHFPDDDSALLDTVRLEAYDPGHPKMVVTADQGRLEQGGDRVFIEGNVVIVRAGDPKLGESRLTTDK